MKPINHDYLRFAIFLGTFITLAIFETTRPRRKLSNPRIGRWFTNLSLTFANELLVKAVLGGAALGAAEYASERGWGFLNDVELSWPVEFVLGFLFLDFMVYLQHVVAHALPFLWRFHMVHHSDLDVDVTTALRFHPLDMLISMFYRIGLVAAMGIDPWTVVLFEIILNASLQFNHSNIKLAPVVDGRLRQFVATPDFHRVHHSSEPEETNSNFGFIISWWDKLCGTYRAEPGMPYNLMQIGLGEYREADELSLQSLITLPASPRMGTYSFKKAE